VESDWSVIGRSVRFSVKIRRSVEVRLLLVKSSGSVRGPVVGFLYVVNKSFVRDR